MPLTFAFSLASAAFAFSLSFASAFFIFAFSATLNTLAFARSHAFCIPRRKFPTAVAPPTLVVDLAFITVAPFSAFIAFMTFIAGAIALHSASYGDAQRFQLLEKCTLE